jgi:adenine deaminase
VQPAYATWSSEQANVTGSSAENVKVALAAVVVPDGPESIVECGFCLSIVQVQIAGLRSTF